MSSKKLKFLLTKHSGRSHSGVISVPHQGGREKRFYRVIDFARTKRGVVGTVIAIEYDPARNVRIALINYTDGDKKYILQPEGLRVGDQVMAGSGIDLKIGNALPLSEIAVGTMVHCVDGTIARSAGNNAMILAKEGNSIRLKMPSGEIRLVKSTCYATIGQLGNIKWKDIIWRKAGTSRHRGIRPTVRGTAQNPRSHPHGGGEGRSGEGMHPKTAQGRSARGTRTRKHNKYSDRFIVNRRKK